MLGWGKGETHPPHNNPPHTNTIPTPLLTGAAGAKGLEHAVQLLAQALPAAKLLLEHAHEVVLRAVCFCFGGGGLGWWELLGCVCVCWGGELMGCVSVLRGDARIHSRVSTHPPIKQPTNYILHPYLMILVEILSAFLLEMSKSSWILTALSFPPSRSSTSAYWQKL